MKRFYIIIILLLFLFFCFPSFSFALSDDVVDTRQAVYSVYDSFNADMLVRLYNLSNGSLSQKFAYNRILGFFKNPDYSYFVTYKTWSGYDYYNAFAYNQTILYLNFYKKNGLTLQMGTVDNWSLINTGMREITSNSSIVSFEFLSDEVTETSINSNQTFYLPNILVNYYPQTTIDFVQAYNNNDTSLLQQIVANSERTATATEKIQEFFEDDTQPTASDVNNSISSNNSSYNNNISIPTSSNPNDSITSIFTNFTNAFTYSSSSVDTINIPIPFVRNKNITLSSNMISRHIFGTDLYVIIQLIYTFIFAKYFIRLAKRILNWLDRGEAFTEGGFSKFLNYLSEQNVVINASLM